MQTKAEIIQIIFEAIDEINKELKPGSKLIKNVETALVGESSKLDSLGVVSFITAVEQKMQDKLNLPINLVGERVLFQDNSPFESVNSLAEYILLLLK